MISNSQEDNIKRCLMSLLYIQTKEVEAFYNKNIDNFKDYYLIDKEWLDNFKESNNYNDAVQQLQNIEEINYDNLKQQFCKEYQIDANQLVYNFENSSMNQEFFCKRKKFKKENIDISYPAEFQIVKKEFFPNITPNKRLDDFPIYKILIGNQSIVIIDNKMENVAFIYNLFEGEFKIRGILVYDNQEILQKEMSKIIYFNGIDKYFFNRKLVENKKDIQKIIDREDEEWGYFYSFVDIFYYQKNISINIFEEAMNQSKYEKKTNDNELNNIRNIDNNYISNEEDNKQILSNKNSQINQNNNSDLNKGNNLDSINDNFIEDSNSIDSFSKVNPGNIIVNNKVENDSKIDNETNVIDGFSNVNPGNQRNNKDPDNKLGNFQKKNIVLNIN